MRAAVVSLSALLPFLAVGEEGKGVLPGEEEKGVLPGEEGKSMKRSNRLSLEKSPYLLQHAQNPVDWFPWGTEAFEKARKDGKPVFLSIGYSTCHWCHVMERESFEDETIAAYLNEHFVAIKVDREERPDVDAVYMAACQAQAGNCGWPLSAFLTPEGKPFFTGTYFPPADDPRRGPGFLSICGKVVKFWAESRANLVEQADRFAEDLKRQAAPPREGAPLKPEVSRQAFETFQRSYDDALGGFGRAPKFPRTSVLDFLLRHAATKEARAGGSAAVATQMVTGTLDALLRGGIRDHLAGGFHRYSTDRQWLIPHFEKMLYDQALIARTLVDAWRVTGTEAYRQAARDTLDYVLGRMSSTEGGFYSAEDADTQGVEGKTYTWHRAEILDVLGKERGERFADFHGATDEGNFEEGGRGANVLYVALEGGLEALAQKFGRPAAEVAAELAADRAKLLAVRDRRPQPLRDDKVLVEWNGLAISALSQVYQVTGEAKYIEGARRAAAFILERMTKEGRLLRRFRLGEAAIDAFLEDHAALAEGLLDLYEAGFETRWLEEAVRLGKDMIRLFWDEKRGAFLSSGGHHEALIIPTVEFYDGAVPSGNSIAFLCLLRLAEITGDDTFRKAAARMEKTASALLEPSPEGHPLLLCGAAFLLAGAREIVIAGPASDPLTEAFTAEAHRRFLPAKVLLRVESAEGAARLAKLVPLLEGKLPLGGKPAAFVCRGGVCKLPARDLATFRAQLEN